MAYPLRYLADLGYAAVAVGMQWKLTQWILELPPIRRSARARRALRRLLAVCAVWLFGSGLYGLAVAWHLAPLIGWMEWVQGGSLLWGISVAGLLVVAVILRSSPEFDPKRRRLLGAMLSAGPVAVAGFGTFVERHRFRVVEIDIPIPGLPPALDGFRIAHLSDIHLSPFLEAAELRRVVAMANETRPHLSVVTGDLITLRDDRLSDCLGVLRGLRADAGVFGCLGNHEMTARCQQRTCREAARLGIVFLRGQAQKLRFGSAVLNLAGVDYQRMGGSYLEGADKLVRPGEFNILLSHNPDVFPTAAGQGWNLVLAGHTHGGQITLGILLPYVNVARLFTPYVYGLYQTDQSRMYVTRGIGTVGVPARIGAPPEVGLLRLCAT